ncbi:hypothetical protein CANARDRAFT_23563 [[Candida] arabinofermentans NRRL YB-2248]|uniref:Uncharacterized protein n=1 Tax=[Candida] arabinofermentans NRRL YB-2248 TaxID=983967 RepID=A0A1E4SZU2_9ASCO|nr:hypothetical protein CANARDRAFT_23563 [[Candida] arabinofermentans NRRL YB-2248]
MSESFIPTRIIPTPIQDEFYNLSPSIQLDQLTINENNALNLITQLNSKKQKLSKKDSKLLKLTKNQILELKDKKSMLLSLKNQMILTIAWILKHPSHFTLNIINSLNLTNRFQVELLLELFYYKLKRLNNIKDAKELNEQILNESDFKLRQDPIILKHLELYINQVKMECLQVLKNEDEDDNTIIVDSNKQDKLTKIEILKIKIEFDKKLCNQ